MSDREVVEMSRGITSNLMFCVSREPTGEHRVFVGEPIAEGALRTFLPSYTLISRGDLPRCLCHGRTYKILYMGEESELDLVEGCEPLHPSDYDFDFETRADGVAVTKKQ